MTDKENLVKFENLLKDKIILRIDKTDNAVENKWEYAVLCALPEKKILGSVFIAVDKDDVEGLNKMKSICIERMKIAIKGNEEWIKILEK